MPDEDHDLYILAYGKPTDPLPEIMNQSNLPWDKIWWPVVRYLAKELYDLKHAGQGVKLEVPAQTHVPYLDN